LQTQVLSPALLSGNLKQLNLLVEGNEQRGLFNLLKTQSGHLENFIRGAAQFPDQLREFRQ
jgi:hypothetical protein